MKRLVIILSASVIVFFIAISLISSFLGIHFTAIPIECGACEEVTFVYRKIGTLDVCPKCYDDYQELRTWIKNW